MTITEILLEPDRAKRLALVSALEPETVLEALERVTERQNLEAQIVDLRLRLSVLQVLQEATDEE